MTERCQCHCTIHIAKVEVPAKDPDRWIADRWLEEQDRKAKLAAVPKAATRAPVAAPAPAPTLRDVMRVAVAYVRTTRFGQALRRAPLSAGHRHESQSGDANA